MKTSRSLLGLFLLVFLFAGTHGASALLVGDDGRFEPIIVQIKESVRTSADLDDQLGQLDSLRQYFGLTPVSWWAGPKLLVMYSFSDVADEQFAQAAIAQLQQSSAVEKVVVQSAFNLEFSAADFSRVYAPNAPIPDEARRGFDWDRVAHSRITYDPTVPLPLHVSDRVIVHWKDEYVWYASQNKNFAQFNDVNALAGCTVLLEQSNSSQDLTQVLQFDSVEHSLVDQLLYYQSNNLVDYVQPDYIYDSQTVPNDPIYASQQWSLPKISARLLGA